MLFRDIISAYAEFLNVRAGGTYNYQYALNG
jgi:hypothetical protein